MNLILEYNKFNNQRIVLTGSPGTGKTTLSNELLKLGYNVIEEAAKELIEYYQENDIDCLPWGNRQCFQKSVEKKNIDNFDKNSHGFFDRSIVDEPGFRSYYGLDTPDYLKRICENYRYDKVFIFKPWKEIFINNEYRKITFEECVDLDKHITEEYINFGYKPIEIINGSVNERIEFILNNIT